MDRGRASGDRPSGVALFLDDEGGYTTVATACALLVSLTLVFGVAASGWTLARAADVQRVADATALAGENVVAAYCTVAQVLDACVLSMGIVGTLIAGAGLIMACVPIARAASPKVVEAGKKVLDARKRFAKSSMEGLKRLEKTIPYLVVVNSGLCTSANSSAGIGYAGCAIPYPQESKSDFSSMADDLDADEMAETAERLSDATQRADEAKTRAEEARERGWRADCVDDPSCLRGRAARLAGLSGAQNPNYSAAALWNFGVPILRSRSYFASRIAREAPASSSIGEVTNSRIRSAYYRYALREVNRAHYAEHSDKTVDLSLPSLARNSAEVRETRLYTEAAWPCTNEDGKAVLHSDLSCPGAKGAYLGKGSLAALERGSLGHCPTCGMDVGDMGKVAAISSSATNGYEYYWRIIVEAARDYQEARAEQASAEREMRELAKEGSSLFDQAMEQLAVPRPKLCPPGAWGCVAVVGRKGGVALPSELTNHFLAGSELPAGIAISGAALAPDEANDGNNVLSRLFDGITAREGVSVGGLLGSVTGVWGKLLVSYGSGYETVSGAAEDLLGDIDGVFGGTVGSWLSKRLRDIVARAGFEPADMRLRKPVLVNTEDVLAKAGLSKLPKVRQLVQSLPDEGTALEVARALGVWVYDEVKDRKFTIAELTIPGTDITIPLTIDLQTLMGGAA